MSRSARATRQDSYNGIVRRMVSLPRSIAGGFSRMMGSGAGRTGIGGRRDQNSPSEFQLQYPQEPLFTEPEEFAFLTEFEQQYGSTHPFFYACSFMEALKIAENEHKLMFMYLHSPQHPFTPSFCRETLCSELVVQFLDANFVSWGGLADRGEGLQMTATLQPASFPCCAVVAPAPGNTIAVLRQMEGPVSPAELVEILQRTVEEQGLAFGIRRREEHVRTKAKADERLLEDRRLREEQDAAYLAALQIDEERENLRNLQRIQKPTDSSSRASLENGRYRPTQNQYNKAKPTSANSSETQQRGNITNRSTGPQVTQVLIRFPNGERREQSFSCSDKIQSVFNYVDSLGLMRTGNYRLVSSFPRRVYGIDEVGMTLKDAALHPKPTLFIEPL